MTRLGFSPSALGKSGKRLLLGLGLLVLIERLEMCDDVGGLIVAHLRFDRYSVPLTAKQFMESDDFTRTRDRILEVLDSDARIPYVNRMGGRLYNFWQDKANPRGVWRSTTLDEYRKAEPKWDVLIDVDALNKAEDAHWVFKGADCLRPK